MKNLRLLKVYWREHDDFMRKEQKLILPENFEFPSSKLRYLHWEGYSLKSLPSNFYGENLVQINFPGSNIRQLWQGKKHLGKLKVLLLHGSKQLIEIPNFSNMPSLEILNLTNCKSLDKIDTSIEALKNLKTLYLSSCKKLTSLPSSIQYLDSLETLHLGFCSNLETFPKITKDMPNLEDLGLSGTAIKVLPSTFQRLKKLRCLYVDGCSKLEKFPKSLESLKDSLICLDLTNSNLMDGAIPSEIWDLSSLEILNLSRNNFRHLPAAIIQLCRLTELHVCHCKMLEGIPELPLSLIQLDAHDCTNLETLLSPSSLLWSSLLRRLKSAKFEDQERFPDYAGIMIPGSSGIPEWLLHQEMETEVRTELPMNWYKDNNFLGFVVFCLYEYYGDETYFTCDLRLHGDDDSYKVGSRGWFSCGCNYYPEINGGVSDELWVTYYLKIEIPEKYHSNQFKHIQASFYDDSVGVIKSCGIHLIYSQDHQQKNTLLLDFPGTQDDDHPDNFQDNTESVAEDSNGNVKRSRDDAEQNPAEEPPHKR